MIPVFYFRSSSYSQWEYCQMSYFITYNLGYQQPSQKKANLGTITHKTLEVLANCKKLIQESPDENIFSFDDPELGTINFTREGLYEYEFVLDCLNKAYEHYTVNSPHIEYKFKEDYPFCKKMVDAALEYNKGQYDPRNQEILAPEVRFDLEINEPWAKFKHEGQDVILSIKGTMDLLVVESEDTLHLCDYKTGARKNWATGEEKTEAKLYDDAQLLLYYYAVSRLYPQYKHIMVTILFLRDGGPFTLCFDTSDKDRFMNMMKQRFNEIRSSSLPKPINKWRSDFRCKRLCHYYKTNWPGTDIPMCNHVENEIKTYGISLASKKLKRDGHEMNFYKAPGST